MNENRSIFALDGITGMLIATVLLLSILAFLSVSAMKVQDANAENFYELKNETSIKRISVDNAKLAFQKPDIKE
jgi:cytochrome c biogenesis factor